MKQFFASTNLGFEELTKQELQNLGAEDCSVAQGSVRFSAELSTLYRTLLWSRLSSRILMPLLNCKIFTDMDLYSAVRNFPWEKIFDHRCTFIVDFSGTNSAIRHSQFGAMRIKDGVVDHFENLGLERPSVNKNNPDIRLNAYLKNESLVLSLDLSGRPLHERGYRIDTGKAPLKETLASMLLMRSGWSKNQPLVDPMCGSGTLLIEGAMQALDIAPNLKRQHWGFDFWLEHDNSVWQEILAEAQQRAKIGMEQNTKLNFYGFDIDHQVIAKAKVNARMAGVEKVIQFKVQDVANLTKPCSAEVGVVVCNPPYGERLGTTPALIALYSILGEKIKREFEGWKASILSSEESLLDCLRMRAERQFKVKNGALNCLQKNYTIKVQTLLDTAVSANTQTRNVAEDFANRLTKNRKKILKWATQEGLDAYRLYDADLPDYNFVVDVYGDYVVIQEYAPPKTIEESKARQRLVDAISATLKVLRLPTDKLILKTRKKQKGKEQYERLAQKGEYFFVNEYQAKLWVNLTDYLDTGLFLDHREVRRLLGKLAQDKDCLNLFAYTGTATVHCALGGAKSTLTVDMSNTYLNWAEQNLKLNHISMSKQHRLLQADCLQWLENCSEQFDLIFVDPPTFSNSKRMDSSWEVERDQGKLFSHLARILRPKGIIIFSNNKRSFKLDEEALEALGLQAKNITQATLPLDFARNPKIHHCWQITWRGEEC